MRIILAISAALALSACAQATGGAGTTARGEPLAGQIFVDPAAGTNRVDITSPGRWTCSSQFGRAENTPNNPSMTRTVPLTCSNGATGQLVLTGNQFQQQIVGSFRLSNGESGQVTFGMT